MKTTTAVTTIPPLSQSKRELLACPHLYVSRVVQGIQEPENEFSIRGNQVHKSAADYVNHLVPKRRTSDEQWFEQNVMTRPYLPDAIEILERMKDSFSIDPEKVLDTELWLPLDEDLNPLDCEPGDDRVAYEGTIDLLTLAEPTWIIIDDYKTYWQIIEPDTFQSDFYPLLAFKHYTGIEKITFRLQFPRYGNVSREKTFTRDDLPKLEAMAREARLRQRSLHEIALAHEGIHDQAMSGPHCAYCPKLRSCPLGELNPMTEDPSDVVRRALWAQQLLKHDMAIAKAHVNVNGPIQITDANGQPYTATFKLQHKTSYPAVPCLSIVSANDPELAKKATVSGLSQALKAKKRAGLAGLLADHKIDRAQTRFGIVGGAEDEEEE